MKNPLKEKLTDIPVIFDGAIGTEIYRRNFFVNTCYEQLSVTRPEVISEIHRQYLDAGAEVLTTNTYNANARRLAKFGLADQIAAINHAGVALAREVAGDRALVAASIGPVGEVDNPADHRRRSELIAGQIETLREADFILFESLRTRADLAAALEAVAAFPEIPYVVSFAVVPHSEAGEDTPAEFLRLIDGVGHLPTAIGLNCGAGPEAMLVELEKLIPLTSLPIIVQPNAGTPRGIDGRMLYMTSAEYFSTYARRYIQLGAAAVGGCCGITPVHIAELSRSIKPLSRAERRELPPVVSTRELELAPAPPPAECSRLGARLAAGEFVATVEITPPRGYDLGATISGARLCRDGGIDAVNLPDGPRASARISTLITAATIEREVGIETIPHCCCRDRSLIGLQSELLGYAGAGIHNLLFITGDPPKLGDYPFSSGVFDTDSIGLVRLQSRMNRGIDLGGQKLNAPTRMLIGVGADPGAIEPEREIERLRLKVEAGAHYVVTQPVFDPEALFRFLDRIGQFNIPVIAGVWPLTSLRNAEFMRNEVPGVVVPDRVMARMAAADGREAQRDAGIEIARECLETIRNRVAGVQVSAPFGNVALALRVTEVLH